MNAVTALKTFPLVEAFGGTIQGEGPDAGRVCWFLRFGGCDYLCEWCDTLYAVTPKEVRKVPRLNEQQILSRLKALQGDVGGLVVLSGGNPALHELGPLVEMLHEAGNTVTVETQGSVWKDWLADVDRLVISPKPPSSGMVNEKNARKTAQFMEEALANAVSQHVVLKLVAFDDEDLDWIERFIAPYPLPIYLSAGTTQGLTNEETKLAVMDRFRWLADSVIARPALRHVRVGLQLHVAAWGTARGV